MVWLSSKCTRCWSPPSHPLGEGHTRCWSPPSHSLGKGRSASGHSCYGIDGVRGSYTRRAECSNGEQESFALPNLGMNSLVSLLPSCAYFKHYFHLPLNVISLFAKFLRVSFYIHQFAKVLVLLLLSIACSNSCDHLVGFMLYLLRFALQCVILFIPKDTYLSVISSCVSL